MKQVISLIEKHCYKTHTDRHNGLESVLDYMIEFFDIKPFMESRYEEHVIAMKNKSEELFEIVLIFMNKVTEAMEKGKWLDFFGELYETMYQSKGKASSLGQFFTPPSLCDLMSNIVGEEEKPVVGDCACGSGRTLLSYMAKNNFPRHAYYVGEDLDTTSVKMCALNLMIHGAQGKVVRHDTLRNPITYDYGFEINEIRYPFPTPYYSLRKIRCTEEDIKKTNTKQTLMTMKEDSFHKAIKTYLDERAKTDELFAKSYAKKGKSINECCKYIMGEARKRGTAVCMTDEEVYGLAVHYYDEDDIKINPVRETAKVKTQQSEAEKKAVKQSAEIASKKSAEIARKKSAEPEPQKKERYIEGNLFEF